jgi:hypothetical protein
MKAKFVEQWNECNVKCDLLPEGGYRSAVANPAKGAALMVVGAALPVAAMATRVAARICIFILKSRSTMIEVHTLGNLATWQGAGKLSPSNLGATCIL